MCCRFDTALNLVFFFKHAIFLGLDFRLFKDNPMAFWTTTSSCQFESPGTCHCHAPVCVCHAMPHVTSIHLTEGYSLEAKYTHLTCCMPSVCCQKLTYNSTTRKQLSIFMLPINPKPLLSFVRSSVGIVIFSSLLESQMLSISLDQVLNVTW